ncbi:hypothetical protein ATANTOWER_012001 [Ataeniobius toweri]|uniref:Uncharacterized protein n=1 Tax=Ataeniobius toweri TaxID=208326 RepID=A0ABU7C724_9TELE|nr:hypothetical protein [Ataeniobius toweri]
MSCSGAIQNQSRGCKWPLATLWTPLIYDITGIPAVTPPSWERCRKTGPILSSTAAAAQVQALLSQRLEPAARADKAQACWVPSSLPQPLVARGLKNPPHQKISP